MSVKKGDELELEITGLVFGGKGLCRRDGFVVFVDRTVPGDRVLARIIRKRKSYADAIPLSILSPSPDRVDPVSRYSGTCGGCTWQYLRYDKQLEYKRSHVRDCLEHIAMMRDVPVHPVIASEKIFGYRNKMEFSCSDRRWLMPQEMEDAEADSGFALGLHVKGTFYKVLDIEECKIQPELGNAILREARQYMKKSGAPAYGLHSHEGFWRFLMLRHAVAYDRWMVNIITASEDREMVQPLADLLTERHPEIVSVVNNITSRPAAIATGEYEILLKGLPAMRERIGRFEFEISANSFFQTNTSGAARLYETVRQYAGLTGAETVFDLYCGTGAIAISLSDAAGRVIGFEIAESAVADAEKNCRINGIGNCRFIPGDIRTSMAQARVRPEVMVIDPPRAGMHPDVVRQILEICPERMVYVSCNPATLARDLALMADRYRLLEVQPVDMFPHTYHVEAVARLERK
jgi:23S rRNA (uracil1939-C5)-methyltransferase